jgi:hypothetical protein
VVFKLVTRLEKEKGAQQPLLIDMKKIQTLEISVG